MPTTLREPAALPLRHAYRPDDLETLAFAGVITQSLQSSRQPLIRGLSENCFQRLLSEYFDDLSLPNTDGDTSANPGTAYDEFDELVALLLEHRHSPREQVTWLAYAIASAAMGENHLWQDMGLPSRKVLSDLLHTHFPTLAAQNTGDMKWKKFFYRQLCARAGIPICKSPHCADCCDYAICFGPEEA